MSPAGFIVNLLTYLFVNGGSLLMLIVSIIGFVMARNPSLNVKVSKRMKIACSFLLVRSLIWPCLDYFFAQYMNMHLVALITGISNHALVALSFYLLLTAAVMNPEKD